MLARWKVSCSGSKNNREKIGLVIKKCNILYYPSVTTVRPKSSIIVLITYSLQLSELIRCFLYISRNKQDDL